MRFSNRGHKRRPARARKKCGHDHAAVLVVVVPDVADLVEIPRPAGIVQEFLAHCLAAALSRLRGPRAERRVRLEEGGGEGDQCVLGKGRQRKRAYVQAVVERKSGENGR